MPSCRLPNDRKVNSASMNTNLKVPQALKFDKFHFSVHMRIR
jgi:hypothetical protein